MSTGAADLSSGWSYPECRPRIMRLAEKLATAYGTPDLGNLPDPLDECVYIITTYQTDLDRARHVFGALKSRFPTWSELVTAPVREVEATLRPSGFHKARARIIRDLLRAVCRRFGSYSLDALRSMSPEDAEQELRALPGLDIKGARCVQLYSLGHDVLPVDSNTFRFMCRYGVLSKAARYRRRSTHDGLQNLVPESARHALHVNLVVHGQSTCLPRTPRCSRCPVRRTCATGRKAS